MERIDDDVRLRLESIFKNLTDAGNIADYVPGILRLMIGMVKPGLRARTYRRILAAADLIKLNRKQVIEKTLQRFSGWLHLLPAGGSGVIDKRAVRAEINTFTGPSTKRDGLTLTREPSRFEHCRYSSHWITAPLLASGMIMASMTFL